MHPIQRMWKPVIVVLALLTGLASAQEPIQPRPRDEGEVRRVGAIMVPQGAAVSLTMTTKRPITFIQLDRDGVVRVVPDAVDRAKVIISGLQPGTVRLVLTDDMKAQEAYEITVQFDVAQLRAILKETVPTANVDVIPAGNRAVILRGFVAKIEDVDTLRRTATLVLGQGAQVIDALQVGGVHQVQLDVTVAVVNRSEARRRGFSFSISSRGASFGSILPGLTATAPTTTGGGGGGVGVTSTAATLVPNSPPAGANFVLGIIASNFQSLLQALKEENLAKTLAEPKLVTMSGRPARFLAGGQQAVLSAQGSIGGPGVDFRDIGTELEFVPIVLGNGRIYLEVAPRVRNVDNGFGINTSFGFVPGFTEQSVRTAIEMEPGQTFAIGGLIQTQVQAQATKVPVLGELPFIGGLFNTVFHQEQELEVLILVTPHLVDAQDCHQSPKRLPGRETRSPDDYELFLEYLLEAPRGQRQVFENGHYVPAYRNDPDSRQYPCADPLPKGSNRRMGGAACAPNGHYQQPPLPTPSGAATAPNRSHPADLLPQPATGSRSGTPVMPPPPDMLKPVPTGSEILPSPGFNGETGGRPLVIPGMPMPPQ